MLWLFERLSRHLRVWRLARGRPWLQKRLLLGHASDVVKNKPALLPELKCMLNAARIGEDPARALERRRLLRSQNR